MTTDPTAVDLLKRTEALLSALHGSVARHDNLAANLACAGCELRDQIRGALADAAVAVAVPPTGQTDDREAEPETPLEKRLRYGERRNDELRTECKRRGKTVLEQSEKILALEKQLDEVRGQLGAEILRAGQAEAALNTFQRVVRRLANHAAGFRDVLDDSDHDPWARTVGADITELRTALDGVHQPHAGTQSQPADRAAVLTEAADKLDRIGHAAAAWILRDDASRLAAETPTPEAQARRRCPACKHFTCGGNGPCGAIVSLSAVSDEKRCPCTGPADVQPDEEA